MGVKSELKPILVEHLAGQQSTIGELVVLAVRSHDEIPSAKRLTDQQLIDHFPLLFAGLIEYIITDADFSTRARTIEAALQHGITRWEQGYELVEVVREIGLVKRSIMEHGIEKFFEDNAEWINSVKDIRRKLDAFFEDSVAGSVQRYVENFTGHLRSANAELLNANLSLSQVDDSRLRLIRTVSHELANVLNALKINITVATSGKDDLVRSEMLEVWQRNVQEMSELLDDLRNYSVLGTGTAQLMIEEINLRALGSDLEASFLAVTEAAGVSLDVQIDPDLGQICSNRKKIRQIVTNLIVNAVNYCRKPHSTILLEFCSLDQNSWQIGVQDSGIGIPAEYLESIFDEFTRVSPTEVIKGAGLGLAITKRLVEELKGKIQVVSEVGRGSRFTVTLPKSKS